MNGRPLVTKQLDRSLTRAHWEAFNASTVFPNGSSFATNVPLRILCNNGKVRLSDLIIWYQIRR